MGFFDDIGGQALTRRAWPRPDGQLPGPLATRLLLARTDQAAIAAQLLRFIDQSHQPRLLPAGLFEY